MDKFIDNIALYTTVNANLGLYSTITIGDWKFLREAILWDTFDSTLGYYCDIADEILEAILDSLNNREGYNNAKRKIVLITCELRYRELKNLY